MRKCCFRFAGWGWVLGWIGVRLAGAATYYVAAFGADGNSGLSWEAAKLTPKAAVDAALAAAGDGHEVVISNGAYALAATITISERMTVRSFANDFSTVTLDGGGVRRCVDITSGGANSLVAGLTIARGGGETRGGGIRVAGANTVVSNVLIRNCAVTDRGGGLSMSVVGRLTDSLITSNSATGYGGGVDNAAAGLMTIERCLIVSNTAPTGAGMMLQGTKTNRVTDTVLRNNYGGNEACMLYASAYAVFERCDFIDNSKRGLAGDYAPVVSNCTFIGNQGGGLALNYAAYIVDCTFVSNQVAGNGGGLILAANQIIDRCAILHNYSTLSGGGIHMSGGTARNLLIAGNEVSASGYGGGIRAITSARAQIENCTVVGNKAPASSRGGGIFFQNSGAAVTNSIVLYNADGGSSSNYHEFTGGAMVFGYSTTLPALTGGANSGSNLTSNPLFASDGSGYGTNHVLGDLTLQANSPCKNSGSALAWLAAESLDLAGKPRVVGNGVDRGAYEFPAYPPGTVFVLR